MNEATTGVEMLAAILITILIIAAIAATTHDVVTHMGDIITGDSK